jgi:TolB-like protein/tetratricopeptide (TPR) repeat protein
MSTEEVGASQPGGSQPAAATGAVFLSYASEDAAAAERIAAALRTAGVEVWFDKSELRGGDAWDRQIRERIHDCRLFIALISAHTEVRDEGYFRREWKLAVDRTHDMLEKKAFLLPVVIDATLERGAAVPQKFHEVQWTRLPGAEPTPEFVTRVARLLAPESFTPAARPAGPASATIAAHTVPSDTARRAMRVWPVIPAVLVAAALAYLLIDKPWTRNREALSQPVTSAAPAVPPPSNAAAFVPPPHSIAVLPFVNMSGDKEQEYFSDGLTEEILNSLARINELQVVARTSSFYFKGEHADLSTIAHKLNVASVLEGSVRRSGHTIRVTAQLNNAVTGFHLWSQTYDRNLTDVLAIQTEIASAVASALKVAILGDTAARIELGGTRNPAAFDAYLRGSQINRNYRNGEEMQSAIAAYSEAIRLDPDYALAFAARTIALEVFAWQWAAGTAATDSLARGLADANKAVALAPDLAESHLALAVILEGLSDLQRAGKEYERALALAPGNARILMNSGNYAVLMGRIEPGIDAVRRAIALDPLNHNIRDWLAYNLIVARRYSQAIAASQESLALSPDNPYALGGRGWAYYLLGDYPSARSSCEAAPDNVYSQVCLAITHDKLGRHADAQSMLAKLRAARGDAAAYNCAQIYAQWGNVTEALQWLSTAMRLRSPWMEFLKTDPFLDPLRKEPRFQAIERELKFPD